MEKGKIAKNKAIIENGGINPIFIGAADNNGEWLDIEESRRLCHEMVNKTREILKQENANINK
jgi:ketopantoate reductase